MATEESLRPLSFFFRIFDCFVWTRQLPAVVVSNLDRTWQVLLLVLDLTMTPCLFFMYDAFPFFVYSAPSTSEPHYGPSEERDQARVHHLCVSGAVGDSVVGDIDEPDNFVHTPRRLSDAPLQPLISSLRLRRAISSTASSTCTTNTHT